MHDHIVVRSQVSKELLQTSLLRGSLIALPGILAILCAGIWLPLFQMSTWGGPIVLAGFVCIALGLKPYTNLSRLLMHPHELKLDKKTIEFFPKGCKFFELPLASIDKMEYLESKSMYGIAVHLKHPLPEKLYILDNSLNIEAFRKDSLKRFACDLFFPYFKKKNFEKLKEAL